MFIKKFWLLLIMFVLASSAYSQTVKVKKDNARVKGQNADGYEVELDGAVVDVEASLVKFLKPIGKGKQNDGVVSIAQPVIRGKNYTSPIYATVKDKGKMSSAWIGIKASEWTSPDDVKKDLEQLVHDFGVSFHREKIQLQVDESNRALQAVQKQQTRLVNQNKDLNAKLESNKKEKIKLEKALADNKLELETLTKNLAKNKKDQDSVAIAGEQIKKVIEMHKARQKKVN